MTDNFDSSLGSSPLLKSVFDNATINAVQVMDTDGFIIKVNTAFTKSFGYTTEDLYGKHLKVLFTKEDQAMEIPEREIEKVNQHGFAVDRNYTIHKDGSCVWVSGESTLTTDGEGRRYIVKLLQDIHEQKMLEKFLKESKEFSDSVVRSIADGLIVFDLNCRILKANNAFYNLFKINEKSVEGLHLHELSHPLLASEELKQHVRKVIETEEPDNFKLEWAAEENLTKHFSLKASFIDGALVNKRIVIVISDITDKINAERQRDDLLAFVIHELRNPLANITLCNTLLEQSIEENDKEGAAEFITKSNANTRRIKVLIQELYDATQAGSGNLNFNKTSFSFEELVKEVIEGAQLSTKSHKINKSGTANTDINGDRSRISQALNNYLLNAIKYSPDASAIDVQLSIEDGSVVVAVKDFGKGIAEEKIPHVFERYYRADNTTKIEGLGLGLYLTKKIIDAHNGRVWVKSKVGEGSTFYFSIPKV